MKRFLILLSLLFCDTSFASTETINWYVDSDIYATTTCQTGGDITLPTTPTKRGYTFQGWLGYIPIEYLESTGQWIDTEAYLEPDAKIETKYTVVKVPTQAEIDAWVVIYQSRGTDDNQPNVRDIACYRYGRFLTNTDYGVATPSASFFVAGITYEEYMDSDKWIINGTTFNRAGSKRTKTTPAPMYILNTSSKTIVRMYYFKIWNNNTLVRDMIPVLDPYGTPCMYDKVTKQFFYNQGTGQFIAGPVINQ